MICDAYQNRYPLRSREVIAQERRNQIYLEAMKLGTQIGAYAYYGLLGSRLIGPAAFFSPESPCIRTSASRSSE